MARRSSNMLATCIGVIKGTVREVNLSEPLMSTKGRLEVEEKLVGVGGSLRRQSNRRGFTLFISRGNFFKLSGDPPEILRLSAKLCIRALTYS